ncbi:hypothetical protein CR513_02531, partial [Mucuna pruriens]
MRNDNDSFIHMLKTVHSTVLDTRLTHNNKFKEQYIQRNIKETWLTATAKAKDKSLHKYLHTTTKAQHQMQSGFLLNIIISKGTTIFQLLPSKDKPLLIWWDALLVLYLSLHIINRIRTFNLQSYGLPRQGLHKNLHATSQTKHQMKSGLLLNVVIGKGSSILKLFPGKDKPLLIWWNTLLVLNLGFHGYGFTSQGLDKDLHATSQTKHKVEGGFLLDI